MTECCCLNSASQAKAILAALETRDTGRLACEIDRLKRLNRHVDAAESERVALLLEIGRELRDSQECSPTETSHMYCSILRHLAFFKSPRAERKGLPKPLVASFRSAPAEALLQ